MGYLNRSPNSRVDGGASEDDGVMLDCQGRRSPMCTSGEWLAYRPMYIPLRPLCITRPIGSCAKGQRSIN